MHEDDLKTIVEYIVRHAVQAIEDNTDERNLPLDYLAIFSKDTNEWDVLNTLVASLGVSIDATTSPTGLTYVLNTPMQTLAGLLKVIKVRKPDSTRPQRGAPDFVVPDYTAFKEKYLFDGANFSLMIRKQFEMMELKGNDVLVYFPSISFEERQKTTTL